MSPCAGGVEGLFLGCAHGVAADPFQAVGRIPVTGAAVLDEPLFVHGGVGGHGCAVIDGDVVEEAQTVNAWAGDGRHSGVGWDEGDE